MPSRSTCTLTGSFGLPTGLGAEEYLERQSELFAAYDVLLPWFEQERPELDQNGHEWARHFQRLFEIVSEPPLRPYYEGFGDEFFGWLDGIAA